MPPDLTYPLMIEEAEFNGLPNLSLIFHAGNAVQPNHLQQPGTGIDNQAIVNPMLLNSADLSNRNSFSPSQNDLYSSEVEQILLNLNFQFCNFYEVSGN